MSNLTNPFYVPPAVPLQTATDDVPSPVPSGFGAIKGATDVRNAMLAVLKAQTPIYLDEVARQAALPVITPGQPALAHIRSWEVVTDFDLIPNDAMPSGMVSSSGIVGKPTREGTGLTRAIWSVDVSVVINGNSWQDTADRVGWYTAAVRAAVAQHRSLGGFAQDTTWVGESYGRIPTRESRTLGAGVVMFTVAVESVVNYNAGPLVAGPPATPYPTVASTVVTLDNEAVNERLSTPDQP
ncbi:MAG: hypothetical protein M3Y91_09015 [Actinomycetota bacterium]|nr:hypothetical protein [Actinomycetota bacterium]